jgi:hypothetical protein
MSIYFLSPDPKGLLASFTQEIGNGEIKTWRYKVTEKTPIYTHTSTQWKDKAWLKPDDTESGRLTFYVKEFEGTTLTKAVFAYHQAHLAETFTRHFSEQCSGARETEDPAGEDDGF